VVERVTIGSRENEIAAVTGRDSSAAPTAVVT